MVELPPASIADRSVLIVDDNATNRRILAKQLERWGMTSRETGVPGDALKWVRAGEHFDIALLDMAMPEMDGLALAAAIRADRPADGPRIVLISSIGVHDQKQPGIDAFLTKPVKPSALHDTLATVLSADGGAGRYAANEYRRATRSIPSSPPGIRSGSCSPRTTR